VTTRYLDKFLDVFLPRTEIFDDYFPCSKKVCRLDTFKDGHNLLHLFDQEEVISIVQKIRVVWSLS